MSRQQRQRQKESVPPPVRTATVPLWAWVAGVVVVAFLVYAPTLGYGFIWDDPIVLDQLRAIHGLGDLLFPPAIIPKFYYRPLIFLTFLLDRTLGGETPFWFHFTVVFGNAVNTGLVCWLGWRLFGSAWAAAMAALVFAVHPIHVESVAWIAGRSDVIAGMFLMLGAGLLTYEENWAGWLAVSAYAFGLLSKETALAGLVLLPMVDIVRGRRLRWEIAAALLFVTFAYLALRQAGLGAAITGFATSATPAETMGNLMGAVGFYVSKLLLPIGLSAYVPTVPGGIIPLLGLIAGLGGLALCWLAWQRQQRATSFLVAWFFLTLAPSLVVIIRYSGQTPVADRYLYIPSIGASLLLVPLFMRLGARRPQASGSIVAAVVAASVMLAVLSVRRSQVWSDGVLFWQDVATKAPDYAMGHRELAMIYMDRNQLEPAEAELKRALQGKAAPEGRVMTLTNLANLYLRRDQFDAAEPLLEEGLRIRQHPYLYYTLGRLAMMRAEQAQAHGDQDEVKRQVLLARGYLEDSLKIGPDDPKTHVLLGQVLFALQDRSGAREHLEQALKLGARGGIADVARRYLKMVGS